MKLATIKPRISLLNRSSVVQVRAERMRGRPLQRRNKRFLDHDALCRLCSINGRVRAAQEVDHIVPLWAGGADEEHNLQGLCIPCHEEKTALEAAQRVRGAIDGSGGREQSKSGLSGNRPPPHLGIKNPPFQPGSDDGA